MKRRAKIIATIGPVSNDQQTIRQLMEAGMDVVRLNFSHGDHATYHRTIRYLRDSAQELNRSLAIMQDLSGPKIRTGELENDQVELIEGKTLAITTQEITGTKEEIHVPYQDLPSSVEIGGRILLDDGQLELVVKEIEPNRVITEVVLGGTLKPHKGVNLPGADLKLEPLTEKDIKDLKFGLQHNVDAIALSFVHSASDIERLRQEIAKIDSTQADKPIIAKIEHPDALQNLHEIVHASDGVMVARGDLGIEMPAETIPIEQKRITALANSHLSYVIIATQMLDSMVESPRPTRAEATDVANAILDGSDAVMLSGETAIGNFPVKTVEMMASIISQSEDHIQDWGKTHFDLTEDSKHDAAVSITRAARDLAHDQDVEAIAVFTQSGRTARLMSKARPTVPILAFTPLEKTYRYISMLWGTTPYLIPHADSLEDMLVHVNEVVIEGTPVQPGQEVVLIAGFPINKMLPPNFALLHTVEHH
ncbi:MAG: pyruvate kinase [Anaerolineales bacterium]|nr:pyruvate kinase [Anaerolineales bacterium]MBS3752181.1 pyruvate kinase [Anaerolineales bacterium]